MGPSIAILELATIARGIEAGDAMVKRSPLDVLRAGTVHPGHYLVLVAGRTADVEEAVDAGRAAAGGALLGLTHLPDVHPAVVAAMGGERKPGAEALGVIETSTVTAVIHAADAGMKNADVVLREIRLADGLGGKGYVLFAGTVSEVEAAVEHGVDHVPDPAHVVDRVVIAQLHDEMDDNLRAGPKFLAHIAGARKSG